MALLTGMYFEVYLAGPGAYLNGKFTSVSGLGMEADYEVYIEGGSNCPRFFLKSAKPQVLVLEQGVLTDFDGASLLMTFVNAGMSIPLGGTVILHDSFGQIQRTWTIAGAHLQKYIGPQLNSNQPALAVTRMEFVYGGCT